MTAPVFDTPVPLDRDVFMRRLIECPGYLSEVPPRSRLKASLA